MTTTTFEDVHGLMSTMVGDEKHAEAATSTADALWVLYDRVLRVTPRMAEDRDRFFLSKGHGPMAYYAVLAAKGFFDRAQLHRFGTFRSPLGMHPDRVLVPGVEASSGSLGHGLPLAVGTALGLRARGIPSDVWVLMGDGELDEGSNHEAVAYAVGHRDETPKSAAVYGGVAGGMTDEADDFIRDVMADMMDKHQGLPR